MYVTSANECYALDAGSGRQIWHYQRPRTKGLIGNVRRRRQPRRRRRAATACSWSPITRISSRSTATPARCCGKPRWPTGGRTTTARGAPLVVGDLVIAGISGGDEGVRGFLAAYDSGHRQGGLALLDGAAAGRAGIGDVAGESDRPPGGAATWMTGTYDPELDTLYWPVGNPGPDMIGDDRLGDNLYPDSIVALDPKTGRLKWHFQFTPHDVWDYDAQEPPALVDVDWQGQPRKLLVQANRNGFFYVLDRTNGKFLLGTQYVKNVTWASGLTPEGRPIVVPDMEPTLEGKRVCPSLDGASNWYSASFNPATSLYYVQTNDKCGIFTRTNMEWEAGKGFMGGSFGPAPEPAQRVLRAIDIQTGKAVWELPQTGAVDSWGGMLSTAGGVVIFGEDSGALMAADAATGKALWSFQTSQLWKASPMTYMFDNKQYIAVAAGPNIIAFGL